LLELQVAVARAYDDLASAGLVQYVPGVGADALTWILTWMHQSNNNLCLVGLHAAGDPSVFADTQARHEALESARRDGENEA
jgi:hypothetical protein